MIGMFRFKIVGIAILTGLVHSVNASSLEKFFDSLADINETEGGFEKNYFGDLLTSETANAAARLLLSYINSTTTISASYTLIVILGIAAALLSILGIAYSAASTIFTGSSVDALYEKRSLLKDHDDDPSDFNLVRIVTILNEMDELFRRVEPNPKKNECYGRLDCGIKK